MLTGTIYMRLAQQELLLSGQTRSADVLTVRVVESQEGQNGVNQPQNCYTPQRDLQTRKRQSETLFSQSTT